MPRGLKAAACLVAALLLTLSLPAPTGAAEKETPPPIEESWSAIDETAEARAAGGRQARASIYRGDHLVALRCHRDGERRWESLVVGATWFLHPKSHLTFELSVDEATSVMIEFERETDYRFAATNPPRELIEALSAGNELTIGGPDFDGRPVAIPLKGSRDAIEEAFAYCGYEALAS